MDAIIGSEIWKQIFVYSTAAGSAVPVEWWALVVRAVLRLLIGIGFVLTIVPGLIWLERRLLGWMQGRLGPNRVGPQGIGQPIADGIKLFFKEDIIPTNVDRLLYILAPAVALTPVLLSVGVLPWNGSPEWGAVAPHLNVGILFLLAVASIEVYGVILAGWASNNKYSLLGGLRASSQVISYELGMGLSIIAILLMTGTLLTQDIVMGYQPDAGTHLSVPLTAGMTLSNGQGVVSIVEMPGSVAAPGAPAYTVYEHAATSGFWDWNILRLFPFGLIAAIIYLISMVAETNRAPFDLPEAETELVAGFHTEYSSMKFAMFFMGEYANMLIVSAIAITLFFGGWLSPWGPLSQIPASAVGALPGFLGTPGFINAVNMAILAPFWFGIKLFLLICFFIWLRATLPRLRYDMLMQFGWKGLLPTALVNVVLIALTITLQEQFQMGLLGRLIAIAVGLAICAVLLFFKYLQYRKRRRDARTTDLSPIRRPSTAVSTPAREIQ